MLKKAIISGVICSSILLMGCNEETSEVVLIDNEEEVAVDEQENTELLSELKNDMVDSIEEQTGIDSDSIVIMTGGSLIDEVIDISISFPKDLEVDNGLIQQIAKDSIKRLSETENIDISEEDITIKTEKY